MSWRVCLPLLGKRQTGRQTVSLYVFRHIVALLLPHTCDHIHFYFTPERNTRSVSNLSTNSPVTPTSVATPRPQHNIVVGLFLTLFSFFCPPSARSNRLVHELLFLFCFKKLHECRGMLSVCPPSCSCCMLCLCVSVWFRSEIHRQVISRLQEPAMTSLPLHHRPNAIRASHVIHKPGSSKPFISAMAHIIIVILTCDKILNGGRFPIAAT